MALIPFGPYLPDQPDFQNPGSNLITNVLPWTQDSYGPAPSLATITDALDARCQGSIFVRDSSADVFGFAGDATKLYELQGSMMWNDVSSLTYNTLPEENWNFAVYGEKVLATNYTDPIQQFDLGASTIFTSLSANAPNARYITVVKDFVMVANTNDGTDGPVPQRVWWSAIDDPTNWPTPGTVLAAQLLSDFNDLAGDGGWNQGIVGGLSGADAIILQEKRVWRAMFVGPPVIFTFDVLEGARGTPAPGSIVYVGSACYYLGDNGFYVCDGINSQPIGREKVDRTFWEQVDQNYLYRIVSAADPVNKLIYWAWPGPQNVGGLPNRILVYNYDIDRWALQYLEVEDMLRSYSTGYTMDGLDVFGDMESMPQISLDSRVWTGGKLSLSAFTSEHKMANFAGPNLEAVLDTSEAQLFDKARGFVSRVWPMVDTSNVTMQVGYRDNLYQNPTWTNPQAISTATASCSVRANGFYHRGRVTIPADTDWNHAQGVQMDAVPAGRR